MPGTPDRAREWDEMGGCGGRKVLLFSFSICAAEVSTSLKSLKLTISQSRNVGSYLISTTVLIVSNLNHLKPGWLSGKEPAFQETQIQSLGREDPLEKE